MDGTSVSDNQKHRLTGKWNRLYSLPPTDPQYIRVAKKFHKGWNHPNKPKARVHAIFEILTPPESLKPYIEYQARVEAALRYKSPPTRLGNEQLLFHGTNRCCLLAEDDLSVRLCGLSECFLCCIIRGSFDVRKCGTKNAFRRFGNGIYTSKCSSKADDYSWNAVSDSPFRVLLVNKVIVGRPHTRRQNAQALTKPPHGFHSVVGEPGGKLVYEETVVYDNDAIRPAYVIVYGNAPEFKSKLQATIATLFKTPVAT